MKTGTTAKINILDYKFEAQREKKRRRLEMLAYLAVLLLIIGAAAGVSVYHKARLVFLQLENQSLTQQRQQLVQKPSGVQGSDVALVERQRLIDKLKQGKVSYRETIEGVNKEAQPDISLSKVNISESELTVNGFVDGQEKFIDFTDRLLKLPGVKGVKSVDSQLNDKTGEVAFKLVLNWEVAR